MFDELKEYLSNYSIIQERKFKNKINYCYLRISINKVKTINNDFLLKQGGYFWINKYNDILFKWIKKITYYKFPGEYYADDIAEEVYYSLTTEDIKNDCTIWDYEPKKSSFDTYLNMKINNKTSEFFREETRDGRQNIFEYEKKVSLETPINNSFDISSEITIGDTISDKTLAESEFLYIHTFKSLLHKFEDKANINNKIVGIRDFYITQDDFYDLNLSSELMLDFEYLYDRDNVILTDLIWAILIIHGFDRDDFINWIFIDGHNPSDRAFRNKINDIEEKIMKLIKK